MIKSKPRTISSLDLRHHLLVLPLPPHPAEHNRRYENKGAFVSHEPFVSLALGKVILPVLILLRVLRTPRSDGLTTSPFRY